MTQDRTRTTSTIPTNPATIISMPRRPMDGPGDMRVWIAAPVGQKIQPLKHARTDATVQATVYVQSIAPAQAGRARGLVTNNTGTAIFTVASGFLPRLDSILQTGAQVTIRGTVTRVGRFPTIDVWAARAVTV